MPSISLNCQLPCKQQGALGVARTSMGDEILWRPMLANQDFQSQVLRAVSSSSAWLAPKPQEPREAKAEPWSRLSSCPGGRFAGQHLPLEALPRSCSHQQPQLGRRVHPKTPPECEAWVNLTSLGVF